MAGLSATRHLLAIGRLHCSNPVSQTMRSAPISTSSSSSSHRRRPNGGEYGVPQRDSSKAKLFFAVACIWPLVILALFASSAPHVDVNSNVTSPHSISVGESKLNLKHVLDRVDILGYGPTHPRVGAVIVGDDRENLVSTVESFFRNTDMNRVFVVCVVVDGHKSDLSLVNELMKIDSGAVPHLHGDRLDIHTDGNPKQRGEEDEDPHGRKVHVIFNEQKVGVAESRADAVEFIKLLEKHHEEAGLKSPEEDLILLLLQSGAQLTSRSWLKTVTEALIVPPPIIETGDTTTVMKLANAVSFNLEGPGKRTSFDTTFTQVVSEPTADEINESSGASYPTPAFNGAALALRLDTYVNLPSQDTSLMDAWHADLELSLNLWLCADGIDIIKDLEIMSYAQQERSKHPPAPLAPQDAARFAAAWMDEVTSKKFFNAYTRVYKEVSFLEWETHMSKARSTPTFTKDLVKKCRSFRWYAEHINPEISDLLTLPEEVPEESVEDEPEDSTEEHAEPAGDGGDGAGVQTDEKEDPFKIPDRVDKKKPSKPLCDECLEIVQKAQPIDISYVDVTGGHKEHPHLGAKDVDGNFGYIHDETALRKNPPKLYYPEENRRRGCSNHDNNWRMLNEKVFVDLEADKAAEESGKRRDTIFCLVYTIDSGHPKIPNIRQTWG